MCSFPNKINWKFDKIKSMSIKSICAFFDYINKNILMIDNIETRDIGTQVDNDIELLEVIVEQPNNIIDEWNILEVP